MKRYLTRVLIASLAVAVLCTGVAWAHHRPGNEVTIGVAVSKTGRYAEPAGRYVNSYRLFVDERNAAGGWLGHKIKLVVMDDKSDKQTSIKLYEKLITQDKVDFTIGPYSSGITDATANIVERYKYPTVAPGASSGVIWQKGRKYVFNVMAVAQDYQKGALHLAKEIGAKRVAIIGENSLFPKQSAEGAVEWAKKLGLQVVLNETYPKKQADFTGLLQRIKSKRADVIVSNSYFADAAAQIRQLKELNVNVKMFSGTVGPSLPRFAKELGGTAEYVLGFSQWEPKPEVLKRPGMEAFIKAYEQRYGVKPNYHAGTAYTAMQVLEAAVKQAGSFDRQKVWQTLRTIETTTVMGPWKVDENNLNSHEGLTFQIMDGQRKIVWPEKLAEVPYKLPMPEWNKRPMN
jgi:branched-chain amino acid transport system substrate-binding protein